ncbi:hypothetical protein BJ170DRAFT_704700 [Xylariales sp. AK1849]|nr:hypothetical protein BJ170DRAFT_704700 [Xylariales sp. AK1849]
MATTTIAIHRRPRTNGPPDHTDFLKRVATREANNRVANRPNPLSAEEHAAHRKQLERVQYIKPKYAAETEINVTGIFGKWKRVSRETMMDFFLFTCENYKIKSRGSSEEYIRQFAQLHTTVTGRYIDRNNMKELYKYHDRVLVPRFGLRPPNIDGKPVLNVDSLRVILIFNIAYDGGIFPLERHRVNLSGCYMILCYTGARPAELVNNERKRPIDGSLEELFGTKAVMSADRNDGEAEDDNDEEAVEEDSSELCKLLLRETIGRDRPKALCYEDILMMIVRHPVTGRAIPAMSIKFIHHKGYDNKPRPTIFFFTPSKKFLFCPLLIIISLALDDGAFDANCLTDAKSVLGTEPIKLKTPVFRRTYRGDLSGDEAMMYSKLRDDMGRQSLDAGGAGNPANGNAPDAVRDQMMRHNPEFYTFQDAYLNQITNFDLQNAFSEEEIEDQLFRLFAHVSLTRDLRATRDMVPDEIVKLEKEREELKQGQYPIYGREDEAKTRTLTNEIRTKRAQRERQIVKEYREYYFYNRPTWDLERQVRGDEMEEYTEPTIDLVIPERARLVELLCHQPKALSDEEMVQQSIEVIDLYVTLCGKRETCLDCIGDGKQTFQERTFPYCRLTKRNDHFDDHHLE